MPDTDAHPAIPRLLLVEDEPDLAALLVEQLGALPARPEHCGDGVQGLARALHENWDLIVLDLHLPGLSGLEVLRGIVQAKPGQAVLILTARAGELDRVLGLEIGADDYLTKPFSVLELRARCRALLRRQRRLQAGSQPTERPDPVIPIERIRYDGLIIDRCQRRVWLDESELALTPREFDLLWLFATHPGKVFKRSALLDELWGESHDGYEHTVNTHMNRLRGKLGECRTHARFIETVWGVGYRFVDRSDACA